MLACRIKGHDIQFSTAGPTLRWACERGCGKAGEKVYASAADAQRYATAFNKKDSDRAHRHPTLSTLPLWVVRKLRGR
ncbi:MAG: hypothetical protein ACJ762_17255 [Solirubrobacteraceae bacterium]